jgi:hypothetical protein
MLNLNSVPAGEQREFDLIPAGSIVRAIMSIKPGEISLPEYGAGNWFKAARETKAKWMDLESMATSWAHPACPRPRRLVCARSRL